MRQTHDSNHEGLEYASNGELVGEVSKMYQYCDIKEKEAFLLLD